jgi:hypothetical protein
MLLTLKSNLYTREPQAARHASKAKGQNKGAPLVIIGLKALLISPTMTLLLGQFNCTLVFRH